MRERKRLLRLLVTDVTLLWDGRSIAAHVRLPGGANCSLTLPRPLRAWEAHTTPDATVALITELVADHPHDEVVRILNERGVTGGWGKPFNVPSLTALCKSRGIPDLRQHLRAAGMLTAEEIAAQLGVTVATINPGAAGASSAPGGSTDGGSASTSRARAARATGAAHVGEPRPGLSHPFAMMRANTPRSPSPPESQQEAQCEVLSLEMPCSMALRIMSRGWRMVLATLTNGAIRDRLARAHQQSGGLRPLPG